MVFKSFFTGIVRNRCETLKIETRRSFCAEIHCVNWRCCMNTNRRTICSYHYCSFYIRIRANYSTECLTANTTARKKGQWNVEQDFAYTCCPIHNRLIKRLSREPHESLKAKVRKKVKYRSEVYTRMLVRDQAKSQAKTARNWRSARRTSLTYQLPYISPTSHT